MLERLQPMLEPSELAGLQDDAAGIHTSDALIEYVQALLEHSRTSGRFRVGLSPRAGLALVRAAKAWALLQKRDAVLPEDVQAVFANVVTHRLTERHVEYGGRDTEVAVAEMLDAVAIP